jgi:hypothetical protein
VAVASLQLGVQPQGLKLVWWVCCGGTANVQLVKVGSQQPGQVPVFRSRCSSDLPDLGHQSLASQLVPHDVSCRISSKECKGLQKAQQRVQRMINDLLTRLNRGLSRADVRSGCITGVPGMYASHPTA